MFLGVGHSRQFSGIPPLCALMGSAGLGMTIFRFSYTLSYRHCMEYIVALITWSRVDTVSLICMVVNYDIGSMFLISVFITICLSLPCLYTCLLRAHTSFMLSSGWTSFPSQDYFQG